jgi:hypothetical protein
MKNLETRIDTTTTKSLNNLENIEKGERELGQELERTNFLLDTIAGKLEKLSELPLQELQEKVLAFSDSGFYQKGKGAALNRYKNLDMCLPTLATAIPWIATTLYLIFNKDEIHTDMTRSILDNHPVVITEVLLNLATLLTVLVIPIRAKLCKKEHPYNPEEELVNHPSDDNELTKYDFETGKYVPRKTAIFTRLAYKIKERYEKALEMKTQDSINEIGE